MSTTYRGDRNNLTWALFDYPDAVHGMPGRYTVGVTPEWPADHVASPVCPCRPELFTDTDAAPKPFYEHHRSVNLRAEPPRPVA